MANKCIGCAHWRRIDGVNDFSCNYIIDVGHRRGCSPDNCDKYTAIKAQSPEHEIKIGTLSADAADRKRAEDDYAGYQQRQAKLNRRYNNER